MRSLPRVRGYRGSAAGQKVHGKEENEAWTSWWNLQLVAELQGCFFPTVTALVGLQKLPQYEYSVPMKYVKYGKPGCDLEGLMNFVTALPCCGATTDAGIDSSAQASPFEQSSSLFAFHNSIITPRWQQDKREAATQLFIPRVLLCNNQRWWTPAWQAWILHIWNVISWLSRY